MDIGPQRTTSSGRPIPSYIQQHHPDPEFEDIAESGGGDVRNQISGDSSTSVPDVNYKTPSDALKKIRTYIRDCGFDTIFDLVEAEIGEIQAIQSTAGPTRQERELRRWLQGDGPGAILSLYVKHGKLQLTPSVKECITVLFSRIVSKEVVAILEEKSLRRKLHEYTLDTQFSFDAMVSAFTASMPALSGVLHTAFSPDRNTESNSASTSGDPPTSQATSGSSADAPPGHGAHRGTKPHVKGRNLMINTAMAILCYAKSSQVNLFQGHIGYFLYAGRTPKRVIEPLHRLGISVKYDSIIAAMRSMAEDSAVQLQNWKDHIPAPIVVYDNLNYYARKRDQRLHNQADMLNYTACYVAYNPATRLNRRLLRTDIQWHKFHDLTTFDIIPTVEMTKRWENASRASLNKPLSRYLGAEMRKFKNQDGEGLHPWEVDPVYQLPIQQTQVLTLPVFDNNEAKIGEITTIVRGITQRMGFTAAELEDDKIIFTGDFLTVRNTRY
jgi:hypothetical protein